MNGSGTKAVLALLGLSVICWAQAAGQSSSPDSAFARAQSETQHQQPSLSPSEDDFLSLLEKHIVSGDPPKDGIPAIEEPRYTSAAEADEWLLPGDVVFGVDYEGFVAAYPQRIMVWHEIANESVGDERLSITYCPLTGTAIGFKGSLRPQTLTTFGVSGDLVNSNPIMYDRATDSRWSQILGRALAGPLRAARLEEFPVVWTTWEQWKQKYPETQVLSRNTGFIRNYGRNGPYGSYLRDDKGYYTSDRLLFRPIAEDAQLRPKIVVVGIRDQAGNALLIRKDRLRSDLRIAERWLITPAAGIATYQKGNGSKGRIREPSPSSSRTRCSSERSTLMPRPFPRARAPVSGLTTQNNRPPPCQSAGG